MLNELCGIAYFNRVGLFLLGRDPRQKVDTRNTVESQCADILSHMFQIRAPLCNVLMPLIV